MFAEDSDSDSDAQSLKLCEKATIEAKGETELSSSLFVKSDNASSLLVFEGDAH
jgi:hypothetical protein